MPTAGYIKKANVARIPTIAEKFINNLFFEKKPIIKVITATEQICIGSKIFNMFCQEKSVHIAKFTILDVISKNKRILTKIVSKIFFYNS